ncbi:unnamed protein product [Litomosoides sigmodontis]|uniref:Uncharacterized protein n=1 Tax=Litomosoides sigmodontis TaxID=42156 RepID=A0A3P6UTN5_LITSI|nr:unnamed protein product [Litomosoides sigmodontis]
MREFDVRDCEMAKINNDINCLKEKVIYAKIRSRKNQKIINALQEELLHLRNEFYEIKRDGKNISSRSVDTDYVIDVQNELKATQKKLQLLKHLLHERQHKICKLRVQLTLTDLKMKQSEKERAQQQNLCAKAQIASLQYRIQKRQEWSV